MLQRALCVIGSMAQEVEAEFELSKVFVSVIPEVHSCCKNKKNNNILRSPQSRTKASLNAITFLQRTIVNETNMKQRTSEPRARLQSSPHGPIFFAKIRARMIYPYRYTRKQEYETSI